MTDVLIAPPNSRIDTVADLICRLGDVPLYRVLMDPAPGTATEADLVRHVYGDNKRLVELIDGTLVEKAMSAYAGRVGSIVLYFIERYLEDHDLGITYGANSALRILPEQVRLPDGAFVSWAKLPNRLLPRESIAALVPDIAIEVLSPGNTKREMTRKRMDYFAGGCKYVWEIDPDTKSAEIYTGPEQFSVLDINGILDGADVLPGFSLPMQKLFERSGRRQGETQ